MSDWRFSDWRGNNSPFLWCFDLGEIQSFSPKGEAEDENEPLQWHRGVVRTGYGHFMIGVNCHIEQFRVEGFDKIKPDADYTIGKTPEIPEDALRKSRQFKISPGESFSGTAKYRGKEIYACCSDPRFVAIGIILMESARLGIPFKKYKPVFEKVPTRDAAISYLKANGFWVESPERATITGRTDKMPINDLRKIVDKVSDIAPLM